MWEPREMGYNAYGIAHGLISSLAVTPDEQGNSTLCPQPTTSSCPILTALGDICFHLLFTAFQYSHAEEYIWDEDGRRDIHSLGKVQLRPGQLLVNGLAYSLRCTVFRFSVIPQLDSQLVERLGQQLLPWMDQLSREHLNPSIYVGLRLSSLQAGTKEDLYLHSLKLSYQRCLLRYCTFFFSPCFVSHPKRQETWVLVWACHCFVGRH